jgi:flavin reductase (DIM6/NTAB) family NADH-FMN oxidoreductase RutF
VEPVQPGAVDPAHYRRAIGRFATGVAVVTTFAGRHDHAMTVNSLTSVSLEPVLMLVCVEQEARWHEAVLESGVWGVSILGAASRGVAEWLSSPGRPLHGQLDRIPFHRGPQTQVALLDDALATLECRTVDVHPAGDHSIVVGGVVSVHTPTRTGAALVHYRGRYGTLP